MNRYYIYLLILVACVAGLIAIDYFEEDTDKKSGRVKSELEQKIDEDELLIDVSDVCEAFYGVDEDYGAYYEIRMYDDSTVRYYKTDGAYEVRENSDNSTIIETVDYWIILSDEGQVIKYKKKRQEDKGVNAIGVIGE